MDAVTHVTKVTMPAGEYFVGDPCYSVPDARWSEWLSKAGIDEEPIPQFMVASLDGMAVLGIGTDHGDGVYFDQERREYPVDAGMIGLVPVELVDLGNKPEPFGTHRMTWDAPFTCTYDESGGTIVLGSVRIPTDWDAIEEDLDDWSDDDEED